VVNNPWEYARIDKVDAVLSVQYTRDVYRLRGVELLDQEVDAGGRARLVLHLRSFSGPDTTRTVEVRLAPELAGKEVELEILPGYELSPELAAPEGLPSLLANLPRQGASPKAVVVQYKVLSQGVTFHGHVAPRLPEFALDALRPTRGSLAPDPFTSYARTTVQLDRYLEGHDKVKVKVREVVR